MMCKSRLGLEAGDSRDAIAGLVRVVSRDELARRCDELDALLRDEKIRRALVCSDDPVDIIRAIDACTRSNADLWIAHTSLSESCRAEIIRSFGVQLLITDVEQRTTTEEGIDACGRIHLMTSGTTGQPKIAEHTLDSLLSRVSTTAQIPANRNGKWLLTYQPTAFAGLQVIFTALLADGVVVVPETRSPIGFYEAARRHQVTQISGTPTFWRSFLLASNPAELPLRQVTLGGEAVDQATLNRLRQAFPQARITHIYASTEAGVVFAVHDARAGFPAAWLNHTNQGSELRIQDGILQVRTPHSMRGYRSGGTHPVTNDGWMSTGDVVETVGDRVSFLGRQDSIINVGGAKVRPQEIESFLLGLEGVREARVTGVPNAISGFLIEAEIVLCGEDPREGRRRIMAECHHRLPSYQIPRILRMVDSIAQTASGKKAL